MSINKEVASQPAKGFTEQQVAEYNERLERIEEIHPSKISRVFALCVSGVGNEDIVAITNIPTELIEVLINTVIPDRAWLTLKGETENLKKVSYEVLRTSEVAANVITETSMAKKADEVVNNTLDYLVDMTSNDRFKTIGEAHNTLRSMATLYPILSKRGRLEELQSSAGEVGATTLVRNSVTNYNQVNFENRSEPLTNKDGQVVGVRTKKGSTTVDIMSRRDLDKLAIEHKDDAPELPLAEQIARKVAMANRDSKELEEAVTGSKAISNEEVQEILSEIDELDDLSIL